MADDVSVNFHRIVELFTDAGIEFLVIGGQAETLFGSPRVTYDTDLCYRRTPENLAKLAAALKALNPVLRNAPPDLPFILDARTLQMGMNFTFQTEAGPLDLLGYVEPIGEFDQLAKREEVYPVRDRQVRTISLDDLIAVKMHIQRAKDRESLAQLLAIKQLRALEGQK